MSEAEETKDELDTLTGFSPIEIAFTRKKVYNKLNFGTMTQDHVLSHQKKSPCFGHGTYPLSAFKVCHLVSKSLYHPTANPKIVKVPSFA